MTDITNQVSLKEIQSSIESRYEDTETKKPVINEKAEFAVQMLRKYAHQTGNMLRGTSDLSPLEEWLIIQLYEAQKERVEEKIKPYNGDTLINKLPKSNAYISGKSDLDIRYPACANIGKVSLKTAITCPDCNKIAVLIEKPIRIFNGSEYIQVHGLSYLCSCGSVFTTAESDTETMRRYYSFNSGKNIISPIDKI